jgi:hypothetical protein
MGREEEIRSLAYIIWEQEGHLEGRDYEYWLRAETIWEEQNPESTSKSTSTKSKTAAKPKTKVSTTSKR